MYSLVIYKIPAPAPSGCGTQPVSTSLPGGELLQTPSHAQGSRSLGGGAWEGPALKEWDVLPRKDGLSTELSGVLAPDQDGDARMSHSVPALF